MAAVVRARRARLVCTGWPKTLATRSVRDNTRRANDRRIPTVGSVSQAVPATMVSGDGDADGDGREVKVGRR